MTSEGVYIITGAGSGIGKAVAEQLLASGHRVVGVDLSAEKLSALTAAYSDFAPVECDLMQSDQLDGLIKKIVSEHGMIRGLVHCAGFDRMCLLHLNNYELAEQLFRIHAWVPMKLLGCVSKKGNYADACSCVVISSLSAHEGAIGHTAYAAAKGALEGMLPAAAAELARKKIRLNLAVFGVISTPMSQSWLSKLDEAQHQALQKEYPLDIGSPRDAAELIGFLLSDRSSWITGQRFIADGGHLIRG